MQLNKSDIKLLSTIEPFLNTLQEFIDQHIQGSKALTALAIHNKFCEETDCNLDKDTFVRAFRLSVKLDKITGIEGVKRLGYRRIGFAGKSKSAIDNTIELINPYIDDLQAFIDLHIQGAVKMTASVIYTKFKNENECLLSEDDFIKAFRLAIRDNKITGLTSAYKFGYKRAGYHEESTNAENSTEELENDSCEIILNTTSKITALDKYNWGLQTKKESGHWTTDAYFGTTYNALRIIARKIINREIQDMDNFNIDELSKQILKAEKNIASKLDMLINQSHPKNNSNDSTEVI